eukprot:TRINITY_DN104577_c0_g1_i1.p1 TRINITY_DN104577_c0_g1~~TRINITY_DN104577_c0_g1_i1.p1  ORF type:complete len:102 (+),score=14.80 TRINITY_DN104577_c0_g1_i1:420-725(+)
MSWILNLVETTLQWTFDHIQPTSKEDPSIQPSIVPSDHPYDRQANTAQGKRDSFIPIMASASKDCKCIMKASTVQHNTKQTQDGQHQQSKSGWIPVNCTQQ